MLSILIPTYNFEITKLVSELHRQVSELKINFEILVIDDASNKEFRKVNSLIQQFNMVKYIELEENIGRAKIRNQLARLAKYDNLLFMDCDSQVPDNEYIKKYLSYCEKENLVCGGREYAKMPPEDKNLFLRWFYGVKRECSSAEIRNLHPNKSFMTNNFLISKKIFSNLKFDENISGYGHEDTLFGIELKQKNIFIKHINNPLIHIGLETNSEFLSKTKKGIINLKQIYNGYNFKSELIENIKLLKYYNLVKKSRTKFVVILFYRIFKKQIEKNLLGNSPSLILFDFYKLANFCLI